MSFVYASCDGRIRRQLWSQLESTNCNDPWLVAGDFNIIADQDEKAGGCPVNMQDMTDFVNMIQIAQLTDAGYNGNKFTWTNNRTEGAAIAERLDRVLINGEWGAKYNTRVDHLHKNCSDHTPLLISFQLHGIK